MAGDKSLSDPQKMAHFGAMAEVSSQTLSTELGLLSKELHACAGRWQGKAGTAFGNCAAVIDTERTRMTQALSGIAADVKTAGINYDANDDAGAQKMKQQADATTDITRSLIIK